jgi:hypothetical protein
MSQTENIMIELRELNNPLSINNQLAPGDFSVSIDQPQTIEENDIVSVENVFIDDEGEIDGKIEVAESFNGYLEYYMYLQDVNTSQYYAEPSIPLNAFRNYSDAGGNHPDNQMYFLSSLDDAQPGTHRLIDSFYVDVYYDPQNPLPKVWTDSSGVVSFYLSVKQQSGQVVSRTITVYGKKIIEGAVVVDLPTSEIGFFSVKRIKLNEETLAKAFVKNTSPGKDNPNNYPPPTNITFPFPVFDDTAASLQLRFLDIHGNESPEGKEMSKASIRSNVAGATSAMRNPGIISSSPVEAGSAFSLRVARVYFSLDAGLYDPEDLAQIVTDQITSTFNKEAGANQGDKTRIDGPIPANRHTESEAFTTENELYARGVKFDTSAPNTSPYWVRADGQKWARQVNGTYNVWAGASNFGLTYNGTDRFLFTNLHQSIFDTGSGQRIVRGENVGNNGANERYMANKCGGLVISEMQPRAFWSSLGFSTSTISHSNTWIPTAGFEITPGTNVSCQTLPDIEETVNFTGDLNGLDTLVFKTATMTPEDQFAYDIAGDTYQGLNTAVVFTKSILGDSITNGKKQENGYYQIEVDCGIRSKKIGSLQSTGKIQAIVGRYYSGNTYTQSVGGAGSIVYQHKGSPIQLSNFKVRILMPNGELAKLGPDNTVFLKITKGK